ncbi:FecR domain-containing protein [soil metagenome]
MSMKPSAYLLSLFCLVISAGAPKAAEPAIGSVVRTQGASTGTSDGTAETLAPGMAVQLNEIIVTCAAARLDLAFDDGTRLSVGEKAQVVLDRFVYQPGGASVFHAAVSGPFRFVSGSLGAGASRQASVTTPYALIGIRGTDFWGGPVRGSFGVFLIEGSVSIAAGGREVILTAPGLGTDIGAAGGAPGDPTRWPADKVGEALATVTFP